MKLFKLSLLSFVFTTLFCSCEPEALYNVNNTKNFETQGAENQRNHVTTRGEAEKEERESKEGKKEDNS